MILFIGIFLGHNKNEVVEKNDCFRELVYQLEEASSTKAILFDEGTYFLPFESIVQVKEGGRITELEGLLIKRNYIIQEDNLNCDGYIVMNLKIDIPNDLSVEEISKKTKFVSYHEVSINVLGDEGFYWDPGTSDLSTVTISDDGKRLKYYTKGKVKYVGLYDERIHRDFIKNEFDGYGEIGHKHKPVNYDKSVFFSFQIKVDDLVKQLQP